MDLPHDVQEAIAADDGDSLVGILQVRPNVPNVRSKALRAASILGSAACAAAAVSHANDVICRDWHTFTPLHHAANGGHADVLKVLLGWLPRCDDDAEGIAATGDAVVTVDVRTKDIRISRLNHLCGGVTPLHLAAASGDVAAVDILLNAKADPEAADWNGWRAVDHARGQTSILKLFKTISQGFSTIDEYSNNTRRRNEDRMAEITSKAFAQLASAADEGDPEPFMDLLRVADVKKLRVEGTAVLHALTALGLPTALRIAIDFIKHQGKPGHDPEVARALPLPCLNDLDPLGFAPLHVAAETGFDECVAPLLEADADVLARTADACHRLGQTSMIYTEGGRTALHIAAERLCADTVMALLAGCGAGAQDVQDSFGKTPRELAADALGLLSQPPQVHPSMEKKRRRCATLLGLTCEDIREAVGRDVNELREQKRQQQQRLQRRVWSMERRRELEARESDYRTIRGLYEPLDASVVDGTAADPAITGGFDIVSWVPMATVPCGMSRDRSQNSRGDFVRALLVNGKRESGVEEPIPGVFVFRFLSVDLCARIWNETENYLNMAAEHALPLPIRHDGCLDLSHVFPHLLHNLFRASLAPIRALLPIDVHGVHLRHAFRTKNYVGRQEAFKRHVDKYAVTLNLCLRKTADLQGSGVFFYESDSAESPSFHHEHEVGLAVLHSSKAWHMTEELTVGERGSVIMWFDVCDEVSTF
eukprot:TRINITY_DN37176_c0_g1_i1.p1 TRINITY_DN37176_c0_g1~~TRINITY_DN37176_c0_g1_i1.p1  ORF type:complete len:709 (+),score=111.74 TRINITY_DN37176_c0_g1_i1:120-2246(+)